MKKILIVGALIFAIPLVAMERLFSRSPRKDDKKEDKAHSPGVERHKKDEKEKARTPRDEKRRSSDIIVKEEKQKSPIQRDATLTRFTDNARRASDTPASRATKSASPASNSSSPLRASTVGKRGSLDWTLLTLQETVRHAHIDESLKKWSEKDTAEENLKKLFEEFGTADAKRQQEIYCIVMRTSLVSATKEKMATNFFDISYKVATLAIYNIPGYFSTNHEEACREIKTFYKALFDTKEAYVNKLSAEAPKRDKWSCEQVALTSLHSPIIDLLAQFKALKAKYPQYAKDFETETFLLPEFKKP